MRAGKTVNFIFIFLVLGFISCNSGNNRLSDRIKLSTKKADLRAENDSVIISTDGGSWWINDVNANGSYFYADPDENDNDYTNVKGDWFSVEKQGKKRLVVKVSENKSKNARKMIITLESGNYFDYINVFQRGRE